MLASAVHLVFIPKDAKFKYIVMHNHFAAAWCERKKLLVGVLTLMLRSGISCGELRKSNFMMSMSRMISDTEHFQQGNIGRWNLDINNKPCQVELFQLIQHVGQPALYLFMKKSVDIYTIARHH